MRARPWSESLYQDLNGEGPLISRREGPTPARHRREPVWPLLVGLTYVCALAAKAPISLDLPGSRFGEIVFVEFDQITDMLHQLLGQFLLAKHTGCHR